MKKNTISLMLIAVVISGCSSKQVYDNIQQNAQHECRKLPPSTYQKCMERYSESFEPYTQKREDLLNNAE